MKERITYIRDNQDEFHPDQLEVEKNAMHIKSLKAAKEHRLTFDYDELPTEVGVLDNAIWRSISDLSRSSWMSSIRAGSYISAGLPRRRMSA